MNQIQEFMTQPPVGAPVLVSEGSPAGALPVAGAVGAPPVLLAHDGAPVGPLGWRQGLPENWRPYLTHSDPLGDELGEDEVGEELGDGYPFMEDNSNRACNCDSVHANNHIDTDSQTFTILRNWY